MIKIRNSRLAASAVRPNQYPEPLPQIALFGRSNAGKSSLINTLINRKNLARTSSAPGKTRLLNFYQVDGLAESGEALSWYFVDLPGYGYAKVSKSERDQWLRIIEQLLATESPRLCWQLVDIRHEPSAQDVAMHQILVDAGFPVTLIANKADKLSNNQKAQSLRQISAAMGVPRQEIMVFSAVSREGREALLERVEDFLCSLAPAEEAEAPAEAAEAAVESAAEAPLE